MIKMKPSDTTWSVTPRSMTLFCEILTEIARYPRQSSIGGVPPVGGSLLGGYSKVSLGYITPPKGRHFSRPASSSVGFCCKVALSYVRVCPKL